MSKLIQVTVNHSNQTVRRGFRHGSNRSSHCKRCTYSNRQLWGSLQNVSATTLGGTVIKEALNKAGVSANEVDEVIMGNVLQAGLGQNPARQATLAAGLPETVSALTINKVCGSGLKAVHLATQAILAGDADVIVAGGMENMSQAPYLLKMHATGLKWAIKK